MDLFFIPFWMDIRTSFVLSHDFYTVAFNILKENKKYYMPIKNEFTALKKILILSEIFK